MRMKFFVSNVLMLSMLVAASAEQASAARRTAAVPVARPAARPAVAPVRAASPARPAAASGAKTTGFRAGIKRAASSAKSKVTNLFQGKNRGGNAPQKAKTPDTRPQEMRDYDIHGKYAGQKPPRNYRRASDSHYDGIGNYSN